MVGCLDRLDRLGCLGRLCACRAEAQYSPSARMHCCAKIDNNGMASSSQSIHVSADGLCFYHCMGYALRGGVSDFYVPDAASVRAEVCRVLVVLPRDISLSHDL